MSDLIERIDLLTLTPRQRELAPELNKLGFKFMQGAVKSGDDGRRIAALLVMRRTPPLLDEEGLE